MSILKLPLTNLLLTVLYVCANTLLNFPALLMPKKLQKFWAFMYKQIRIFSKNKLDGLNFDLSKSVKIAI